MKRIKSVEDLVVGRIYKFIYFKEHWYIQRFLYRVGEVYWFYVIDSYDSGSIKTEQCTSSCNEIYEMTEDDVRMEVYL